MSTLLDAEKLRRKIEKLEAKCAKRIEKARHDCHVAILAAREEASSDVLCLLDSAKNLEPKSNGKPEKSERAAAE